MATKTLSYTIGSTISFGIQHKITTEDGRIWLRARHHEASMPVPTGAKEGDKIILHATASGNVGMALPPKRQKDILPWVMGFAKEIRSKSIEDLIEVCVNGPGSLDYLSVHCIPGKAIWVYACDRTVVINRQEIPVTTYTSETCGLEEVKQVVARKFMTRPERLAMLPISEEEEVTDNLRFEAFHKFEFDNAFDDILMKHGYLTIDGQPIPGNEFYKVADDVRTQVVEEWKNVIRAKLTQEINMMWEGL